MTARSVPAPPTSQANVGQQAVDLPVLIKLAPLIFVVIWSTGFIGAKYGLTYAGPFVYLALRMVLACILMVGLALLTHSACPRSPIEAGRYAISGLLLHAGYLGGVFYAISEGMS